METRHIIKDIHCCYDCDNYDYNHDEDYNRINIHCMKYERSLDGIDAKKEFPDFCETIEISIDNVIQD